MAYHVLLPMTLEVVVAFLLLLPTNLFGIVITILLLCLVFVPGNVFHSLVVMLVERDTRE